MKVHYAVQICDVANNQTSQRYCNTDRTALSIKSITSLLASIDHAAKTYPQIEHTVLLVDDHSSPELKKFLQSVWSRHLADNVHIRLVETVDRGLMSTVRTCYQWMRDEGENLVYQIQDDYLFCETSIVEMIDVFFQMKAECNTEIVVSPYNDPWLWVGPYRNRVTPRAMIAGKRRYWISCYDISCSFMTSVDVFRQNWDLMDQFCNMPALGDNGDLENVTVNRMMTERGVLALVPVNNLALHVQSELEKDPYIDWKSWWDKV